MTSEVTHRQTTPKDGNDVDVWDPDVGFWEKWNKHVVHKQTTGIIRHASFSNRWMPRLFYFSCLGGTGWMVWGSIPHYYGDCGAWMLAMEAFTIYVFIQVISNYFLIKTTDSGYSPDTPSEHTSNDDVINTTHHPQTNNALIHQSPTDDGSTTARAEGPTPTDDSTSNSYRILVATAVSGNNIERKSFPYWSWVPCLACKRPRPPRCHHCAICQKCVLKRDHHCYFTRVCVGVNNHRYYLYFLLWCVVLTWHCCIQLVPYLLRVALANNSYWNLLFPFNLYTTLTGTLSGLHLHLILVVWSVCCLTVISSSMFSNGIFLMMKGLTSFEQGHQVKVMDTRSYAGRLRAVFGRNWAIRCFIPGWIVCRIESWLPDNMKPTEPLEDAVEWPYIKAS